MVLPPTQSNKGVEYVNIYKNIFIEGSKSWQNKRKFAAGNLLWLTRNGKTLNVILG